MRASQPWSEFADVAQAPRPSPLPHHLRRAPPRPRNVSALPGPEAGGATNGIGSGYEAAGGEPGVLPRGEGAAAPSDGTSADPATAQSTWAGWASTSHDPPQPVVQDSSRVPPAALGPQAESSPAGPAAGTPGLQAGRGAAAPLHGNGHGHVYGPVSGNGNGSGAKLRNKPGAAVGASGSRAAAGAAAGAVGDGASGRASSPVVVTFVVAQQAVGLNESLAVVSAARGTGGGRVGVADNMGAAQTSIVLACVTHAGPDGPPPYPQVGSIPLLGEWNGVRALPLRRAPDNSHRIELSYGRGGGVFSFKVRHRAGGVPLEAAEHSLVKAVRLSLTCRTPPTLRPLVPSPRPLTSSPPLSLTPLSWCWWIRTGASSAGSPGQTARCGAGAGGVVWGWVTYVGGLARTAVCGELHRLLDRPGTQGCICNAPHGCPLRRTGPAGAACGRLLLQFRAVLRVGPDRGDRGAVLRRAAGRGGGGGAGGGRR